MLAALYNRMGYDLHITRRKHWFDDGSDITGDEWQAYVRNDPELRAFPANGPHFVHWSGQSTITEPWLDWSGGCIYSKYPDRALVTKMLAIARHFGATLQGDDGETYSDASEIPESSITSSTAPTRTSWPLWKQLVIAFLFGCVLLGLRLLIFRP